MLRPPPENPLIAIVGATGTGKSQVSLPQPKLANRVHYNARV